MTDHSRHSLPAQVIESAAATMPRPLLSQRAEAQLRRRHRELLDHLEHLFLEHGFAAWTVRELAAALGCSRRTLYELAPSKDELVLIVLDRFLHRVGRTALAAARPDASVAEQISDYIQGGAEIQRQTTEFAEDLADEPAARRLLDRHFRYVMAVLESLIAEGVRRGEFREVSPAMVAAVITGAATYMTQPEVLADIGTDEPAAIQDLIDFVLSALSPGGQTTRSKIKST